MTRIEESRLPRQRGMLITPASLVLLMLSQCGPPPAQGQQPYPAVRYYYAPPSSYPTCQGGSCTAGARVYGDNPPIWPWDVHYGAGPASTFVYYPVGGVAELPAIAGGCSSCQGGNCSEMYVSPPMQRWGGRRFHLFGRRCR